VELEILLLDVHGTRFTLTKNVELQVAVSDHSMLALEGTFPLSLA
jgi:hypothetical protein